MTIYSALPLPKTDATWRIAIGMALVSSGSVILIMTPEVRDACARAGRHPELRQLAGDAVETVFQAISKFLGN